MIHDPTPDAIHLGPIMEPEQQLLTALANLTDPKVIVEFGYYNGTSAKAFLAGCDKDTLMVSFDILERERLKDEPRHKLLVKDMKEFASSDIWDNKIDIVFFDASHVLEDTMIAFQKVKPFLKPGALVVVHDTGAYPENRYNPSALDFIKKVEGGWVYHCPDEHTFIKYLVYDEGYNCVNLTATSKIRHGIAVLQRVYDFAERVVTV